MKGETIISSTTGGVTRSVSWISHQEDSSLNRRALMRRIGTIKCSSILLQYRFGVPRMFEDGKIEWRLCFDMQGKFYFAAIVPDPSEVSPGNRDRKGDLWRTDWLVYGDDKLAGALVGAALWDVLTTPALCEADEHSLRKERT
jgi:hypothetical protein